MRNSHRRNVATLAAGATVSLLVLAGCSAPDSSVPDAAADGTVTVLVPDFGAERFDRAFNLGGDDYARAIHGFLLSAVRDGDGKTISPGIAEEWTQSEDGLTWTFTVRDGVKFHDGTEVTADDVAWTLQHVMGPELLDYSTVGGPGASFAENVQSIEATGPNEVTITTATPQADIALHLSEVSQTWLGAIYPARDSVHDSADETAYDQDPIGIGPLKLTEHVPGSSMTFERFDDFYYQPANGFDEDRRVAFSELKLEMVPEEATRVAALLSGGADLAPISLATIDQVEEGGGRVVYAPEAIGAYMQFYGCWEAAELCSDPRVRQALDLAIDRDLIRDQIYGEEMMSIDGWWNVTPSTIGYSEDLDPSAFDPDEARALLADAGYPDGDGFGELVVNYWTGGSLPLKPELVQVIADMWRNELGIEVTVKTVDETTFRNEISEGDSHFGEILFRDNETRIDASGATVSNYTEVDRFDRITDDQELRDIVLDATSKIGEEREAALVDMYRELRNEGTIMTIGTFSVPWGVSERVKTWEPYPLTNFVSGLETITLQ